MLWNLCRVASTSLLVVVTPVALMHILDPRAASLWSAVFAIASVLLLFDLGLPTTIQFAIARERGSREIESELPSALPSLVIAFCWFVAALGVGVVLTSQITMLLPGVPTGERIQAVLVLILLTVAMASTTAGNMVTGVFIGMDAPAIPAIVLVPSRILAGFGAVAAAADGKSVVVISAIFAAPLLASFAVLSGVAAIRHRKYSALRGGLGVYYSLVATTCSMAVWSAATTLVTSVGAISVARFDFNEARTWTVVTAFWAALAGAQSAILAGSATKYASAISRGVEATSLLPVLQRRNRTVLVPATLCLLLGVLILAFGDMQQYRDSFPTIAVAAIGIYLRLCAYPFSVSFIALNTQRQLLPVVILDTFVTVVLTLSLCSHFGIRGAALGTLATGAFSFAIVSRAHSFFVSHRRTIRMGF